jgi:peptidoglycan/LPS O-acetylase OafA/YrhL
LLVTLAIAYGLTYSGFLDGHITIGGLVSQLFYFANYYVLFFDPAGSTFPAGTGVLWSLAVEEHFYIVYPLFMAVFLNGVLRKRGVAVVFVAACAAVLVWRIHLVKAPGFVDIRTYYSSDTRIDSIIYGCILAVVCNPMEDSNRSPRMSWPQWGLLFAALALLLATLVYRNPTFRETARYSLQGLALMPTFYFAIRYHDNSVFRYLNMPWLIKIGIYSYVIYLSHAVIIDVITLNAPSVSGYLVFPIALALSVAYAATIDQLIDPYFRKLRQKLRPGFRARRRA